MQEKKTLKNNLIDLLKDKTKLMKIFPIARIGESFHIDNSVVNNPVFGLTPRGKGKVFVGPYIDPYSRTETLTKDGEKVAIHEDLEDCFRSSDWLCSHLPPTGEERDETRR